MKPLGDAHRLLTHRCDGLHLTHQSIEVFKSKGLRSIALRNIWIGMYLHQQAMGAGGYGRQSHRGYQVPFAGAVARIGDDGQVAEAFNDRDSGHIQGEPGELLEGPNPTLTEDDLVISASHYVLGRL